MPVRELAAPELAPVRELALGVLAPAPVLGLAAPERVLAPVPAVADRAAVDPAAVDPAAVAGQAGKAKTHPPVPPGAFSGCCRRKKPYFGRIASAVP